MGTENTNFAAVGFDDHDVGFKDVEVDLLSGKKKTVRLRAVDCRSVFRVAQNRALSDADKLLAILNLAVPEECDESFFRALTLRSLNELVYVSQLLSFPQVEKKIVPETKTMDTVSGAPSCS